MEQELSPETVALVLEEDEANDQSGRMGIPRSSTLHDALSADATRVGLKPLELFQAVTSLISLLREYGPEFWAVFQQIIAAFKNREEAGE